MVLKERNNRTFERCKGDMVKIRNRWRHVFGSLILDHEIYGWEDFRKVIDVLTKI